MGKIVDYSNLDLVLKAIKSRGTLVVAGGCFDILHEGHIKFLEEAKKQGDSLLIILESDESVKRRKGEKRPVNNIKNRAQKLAGLSFVDFVLLIPDFKSDQDYYNLVKKLQPAIIAVTKNDPLIGKKAEQAEMVGGKVIEVIERIPDLSTTNLLKEQ